MNTIQITGQNERAITKQLFFVLPGRSTLQETTFQGIHNLSLLGSEERVASLSDIIRPESPKT